MALSLSRLHLALDLRKGLTRLYQVANASLINHRLQREKVCVNLKHFSDIKCLPKRNLLVRASRTCSRWEIRTNHKLSQQLKEPVKDEAAPKELPNENMFTIPNILCVVRIGMTPLIAHLIVNSQYNTAIALIFVAGVTDLLDGWIARVVPGQSTVMGSFLDPLADKILVGTLFLSLTYVDLIPLPLTALIVGRDVILIAAGFYIRYQSLDPPKTFTRYFNVTLPTAQLAPAFISKVNTGLQLSVVGATLASTVISSVDLHPYLQILWYTTAATTVASAVYYCFAKDTVKMLRQTQAKLKARQR